ncbi:antibiotic biosynthesis monooxygenase family protein [Sphingobium sp. SJ10-10]|uniref:antibiotic biosynthesis monooxygenase family protein n=1 Tax=Sphingobium sp. SJ10-10 TaxID=3114999 RepID=UPI002E17578E|nr:antibiotic biosynthesis monooxygenase family protein [Sphingobium sp. SJ10-10]
MVREVVEFRVKEGMAENFIAGTAASKSIFEQAPGFIALELHHEVEDPLNVMIIVTWKSVQHHLDMQKTPLYPQVREKVVEFLEEKPKVRHTEIKVNY